MTNTNTPATTEDCNKMQGEEKIRCEEINLDALTKNYTASRGIDDGKLASNRFYFGKAGGCAAALVVVFIISFILSPTIPLLNTKGQTNATNVNQTSDDFINKLIFSSIMGVSSAVILVMVFVVDTNLKTQRHNENLAAKSFEIRMKRSKILSLLQQQAFTGEDMDSSKQKTNTDSSAGTVVTSNAVTSNAKSQSAPASPTQLTGGPLRKYESDHKMSATATPTVAQQSMPPSLSSHKPVSSGSKVETISGQKISPGGRAPIAVEFAQGNGTKLKDSTGAVQLGKAKASKTLPGKYKPRASFQEEKEVKSLLDEKEYGITMLGPLDDTAPALAAQSVISKENKQKATSEVSDKDTSKAHNNPASPEKQEMIMGMISKSLEAMLPGIVKKVIRENDKEKERKKSREWLGDNDNDNVSNQASQ